MKRLLALNSVSKGLIETYWRLGVPTIEPDAALVVTGIYTMYKEKIEGTQ